MTTAYADTEAAAGSPAATADEGSLVDTAFRRAEKRYQLHYEQQRRTRKGRRRAGKLVQKPTDLSGVVDIRNLPTCSADITAVPLSVASNSSVSSTAALVFHQHPGLVVFPAAVPAFLQLQLIHAALEVWPEPPARTNHTRVHCMRLCHLFRAAQQGLSLLQEPQQQQQQQEHSEAGEQQDCSLVQQPIRTLSQQQDSQHNSQQQPLAQAQRQQADPSMQQCHQQQPACQALPPQQQHQQQQQQAHPTCDNSSSSSSSSPWSLAGDGPPASLLLRKLRWACLGPPYNWTERVYEPHLAHRPLPDSLVQLAQQFAALAQQAIQQQQQQQQQQEQQQGGDATPASHATSSAGAAAGGSSSSGGCGCGGAFVPDAALVNYYHAGDTLNGHRDDVERDLSQPIVTMSLGCDAVFLMGGLSRDVEPTALLLRSGDVAVLGQEARACYHGVPRVLTDRPLPQELLQAAEVAQQQQQQLDGGGVLDLQPHLQHMQGCRINISIRSTL